MLGAFDHLGQDAIKLLERVVDTVEGDFSIIWILCQLIVPPLFLLL